MMDEIINLLREFGFPIFVVLWFMFRTEKILARNTEAIIKLSEAINKI